MRRQAESKRKQETFRWHDACRFDEQDKRALRALDSDFTINTDGETATVRGRDGN